MSKPRLCLLLLSIILGVTSLRAPSAISQADETGWRSLGPEGGIITAIAVSPAAPGVVYAGTFGGGVFKSSDRGDNWRLTSLRNRLVHAIAIDPVDPNVVYAGGAVFGLSKSVDAGDSWVDLALGLANVLVMSIAIDPASHSTIYAGTAEGVLKSTDGGGTWSRMNTGLGSLRVQKVEIDLSDHQTVYAGSDRGLFRSNNGGVSWSDAGLNISNVQDVAVSPVDTDRFYAAGTNLFWSADGGENWTLVPSMNNSVSVEVDPRNPNMRTDWPGGKLCHQAQIHTSNRERAA